MAQKILLTLIGVFIILGKLEAQENAVCPLKNVAIDKSILYLPQEYIENEKNVSNLFLTAKEGTPIIAPTDGEVHRFSIGYLFSLNNSKGGVLETTKSYSDQKNEFINSLKGEVNPKFVSANIAIMTANGMKYYISGFAPEKVLKSGEIVKKGQLLGYMGYAYHKILKPCIRVSANKNGKTINPMSIFGLKSSFVDVDEYKVYAVKKLTPQKQMEALTIIRESLEEGHPGLYDYSSKENLDSIFASIHNQLTTPITSEEFSDLLKPLLVTIGDSHLSFYGQSKKMTPFPPVLFGLENGKVKTFVATEKNQDYLNKEILEINEESTKAIVEKLKKFIPGQDGVIESVRDENLMLNMAPLYCEVYNVQAGDSITYKFSDLTCSKFVCKQLERDDHYYPMFHYKQENYRHKSYYVSANVAVLRIKTFELFDTDKDSIKKFIGILEKNKCPNLIIDLRGNKGGDCYDLFGMLADKPYHTMLYTKVNHQNYNSFKYAYNYTPAITGLFQDYKKIDDGYYSFNQSPSPINDSINYKGTIYALTDANSLSASTIFAALIHKYKRGLIIGQETGTTYHQMNAAKFVSINIANTGLTMYMPLVKCVFDETSKSDIPWGRGVIPDYPVDLRFEDFFSDNDRIMNFTLDLIDKRGLIN